MMEFLELIYKWYGKNKRDLPWRNTSDPYNIWISEIILQQTRVDQGLEYYNNFITVFPDIKTLASASEDKVLKLWQGLGYYSRARNLHATAKDIQDKYGGQFPQTYSEILSLKGIGPYTAAAISSIAYNLSYPVLDGNVYRVLSRYFGINAVADTSAGKKEFMDAALEIMPVHNPGFHNEALMEFGALQCTPRSPDCLNCPLSASCFAYSNRMTEELPVIKKKKAKRIRHIYYYCIESGNSLWLEKRTSEDIWKNLYQFPAVEFSEEVAPDDVILFQPHFLKGINFNVKSVSGSQKHVLTHQTLLARLIHLETENQLVLPPPYIKIKKHEFNNFPVPRLVEKLFDKINDQLKIN